MKRNKNMSRLLLGLFYSLSFFNVCIYAQSGFLWELSLAKFSTTFANASNNHSVNTTIATLQSKNESSFLKILGKSSTFSWQASIVQAASGACVCSSRAFSISFASARPIYTLVLKRNGNLVLKQGNSYPLWESHSCGVCVKSLKIVDDAMIKNFKDRASKEKDLSFAKKKYFPYMRALQESDLTLGSSNSTLNQDGSSNGGHRNKKALAMEIVFPVAAFLLLAICLAIGFTRRRKAKANKISIGSTHKSRREEDEVLLETLAPGLPPRFTYAEMQEATNGFQKKLGQGGYGAVYEGILPSSHRRIAVKVFLDTASSTCRKGFCAEVLSIGEKKHSNLVQLCGYCVEDDHRMLVYELMENGSLNKVLFGTKAEKSRGLVLSWERRKAIAIDTARALAFLHEEGEQKTAVIHCDVKPENILINENWVAKVSDFGLAKLMWAAKGHHVEEAEEDDGKADEKQKPSAFPSVDVSARLSELSGLISAKGVRGTLGYLAPEWTRVEAGPHTITTASDVYSFGVVLLELVAGRRSMVPGHPFLLGLAFDMLADARDLSGLLDPCLHKTRTQGAPLKTSTSFDHEDVRKAVNLALWCLQEDVNLRPTMVDALNMLTNKEPIPTPPICDYFAGSSHFFEEGEYHNHDDLFSDNTSNSHEKGTETSTSTSQETGSWPISILSGR